MTPLQAVEHYLNENEISTAYANDCAHLLEVHDLDKLFSYVCTLTNYGTVVCVHYRSDCVTDHPNQVACNKFDLADPDSLHQLLQHIQLVAEGKFVR